MCRKKVTFKMPVITVYKLGGDRMQERIWSSQIIGIQSVQLFGHSTGTFNTLFLLLATSFSIFCFLKDGSMDAFFFEMGL